MQKQKLNFTTTEEAKTYSSKINLTEMNFVREEISNLKEDINVLKKQAKSIEFTLDFGKYIMMGVIVVFFIAFLTFTFDAWRLHAESYDQYTQSLNILMEDRQSNVPSNNPIIVILPINSQNANHEIIFINETSKI